LENRNVFLTAQWRKLAFANYAIDKNILTKYLPPFTELDEFEGKCFVSLVGFMFLNTKLLGVKVPFHSSFEEVNLRFYVRYNDNGEWKRGAVFIKEIVPKPAITLVANTVYKEKYQTSSMKHQWLATEKELAVNYRWKAKKWQNFGLTCSNISENIVPGSEIEFITEHYWGYTKLNENTTSEYEVGHPKWNVYPVLSHQIEVDFEENYGKDFSFLNQAQPDSVILAEGSEIFVMKGKKLKS